MYLILDKMNPGVFIVTNCATVIRVMRNVGSFYNEGRSNLPVILKVVIGRIQNRHSVYFQQSLTGAIGLFHEPQRHGADPMFVAIECLSEGRIIQ